jgi:hypothetical protein
MTSYRTFAALTAVVLATFAAGAAQAASPSRGTLTASEAGQACDSVVTDITMRVPPMPQRAGHRYVTRWATALARFAPAAADETARTIVDECVDALGVFDRNIGHPDSLRFEAALAAYRSAAAPDVRTLGRAYVHDVTVAPVESLSDAQHLRDARVAIFMRDHLSRADATRLATYFEVGSRIEYGRWDAVHARGRGGHGR